MLSANVLALGQQGQDRARNGQPLPKPNLGKFPSQAKMEAEDINSKVTLPNLPDFTGQVKFIAGVTHHAIKGQHFIQHFSTKEDAKLVLDWYLNTLNMYKWKIEFNDKQSINAKLPNATCSIYVNDTSKLKTGYKSDVEINYFQNSTR